MGRLENQNNLLSAYVNISANPRSHLLLVLQYVHDYLQSQIGTIDPCYIVCTQGMQSLNYRVRHLLRFEFGWTEPECAGWAVQPGLCVWVWSLERAIRPCAPACIVHHSGDTMCCCYRLWPGQSLKLGDPTNWPLSISSRLMILILLLSSTDGSLLRCMHVFRICRTVRKSL